MQSRVLKNLLGNFMLFRLLLVSRDPIIFGDKERTGDVSM